MDDMKQSLERVVVELEAATEGNGSLDMGIAIAIRWAQQEKGRTNFDPPRYTTSIDAALTLAPPEANCHGYSASPMGIDAWIGRNIVKDGHWLVEAEHKTSAPIALCIAALKARARASLPHEMDQK